jgi:hypothetical protein
MVSMLRLPLRIQRRIPRAFPLTARRRASVAVTV